MAGLAALLLINPSYITSRLPMLYVSMTCFLSGVAAFISWWAIEGLDTLFHVGLAVSFLGTIGLSKSFKFVPLKLKSIDPFKLNEPGAQHDLMAIVDGRWYNPGLQGRHIVKFERGLCFLVETGKRISWITPSKVFRVDNDTIEVDTGIWRYGKLTLWFGSSFQADKAEKGLREIIE